MKIYRQYPALAVTQKAERTARLGHPWIYGDEILSGTDGLENGCIADVFSQKGAYLGTGFFSAHSKIKIRILSRNANDKIDEDFFLRRIQYALRYRRTVMRGGDFRCCRLVFGEADGLPGFTADRFGDVVVTQVLSYGMDRIKDMFYRLLCRALSEEGAAVRGIYERNDVAIRELEGLEQCKGWYPGLSRGYLQDAFVRIEENGVLYDVDVENGQKTGFFLDQKYNRAAVARISAGMTVLDCFTHTGSFALNAALGGARQITAVDISASALEMAGSNARLNGLDGKMIFKEADVFDFLSELERSGRGKYDFIILDPPAFTKSRKTVANAGKGYRQINCAAMRALHRGGYLATCSCSHFMTDALFSKAVADAALEAGVSLRQVFSGRQAPDHPILWNVPETDYLKFYIFQIV